MKVIDYIKSGNVIRLYFGYDKINDYYGDDWDDIPYEHNAGLVYPEFIRGYYDIAFPLSCEVNEACTGYSNSPYSKNDLKKGVVPCLHIIDEEEPVAIADNIMGGYYNIRYNTLDICFNDNIDELLKSIKRFGGYKIKYKLFKILGKGNKKE